MNYIITALTNQLMLIICLALIIVLAILWCDLVSAFRELDRLEAEEEQEDQEKEQRAQITLEAKK